MKSNRWQSLAVMIVCAAFVVACGEAEDDDSGDPPNNDDPEQQVDPDEDHEDDPDEDPEIDPDEWDEQRSGLDLDPLQGASLPVGPDMDEVPEEFHPEISSALSMADDARLLLYDGRYDEETYFYRAPIPPMENFSDEAFETAMKILRRRNDRMGAETTQGGIANGWSDGEGGGYSEIHDWTIYDPDVELPEDEDLPTAEQSEAIESTIEARLQAEEDGTVELARDDEGRVLVRIEFAQGTWPYFVDVFAAEEVENSEVAEQHGLERLEDELEELFDKSDATILDYADCASYERYEDQLGGVWACADDAMMGLADVPITIEQFYVLSDGYEPASNNYEPGNSGTMNAESNTSEGGDDGGNAVSNASEGGDDDGEDDDDEGSNSGNYSNSG